MRTFLIHLAIVIGTAIALLGAVKVSDADHGAVRCGGDGEKACLLLSTNFIENVVKQGGEYTYCFNQAALNYPDFRRQTIQVTNEHAKSLKITAREVPYDSSCMMQHDMVWNHPCSGCSAWIWLQNEPVKIEYNQQTGHVYLFSTIGHELGHGECALDEHYDKAAFTSFINRHGFWQHGEPTVMDSGTHTVFPPYGIWWLTEYDIERCEETLGFSLTGNECLGPTVQWPDGPATYDTCTHIWVGPGLWDYHVDKSTWYDKAGRSEWGDAYIIYENGRAVGTSQWNHRTTLWHGVFADGRFTWNPNTNGPWIR